MSKESLYLTGWKHLVSGIIGGSVSVLALHPLDLAKIRLQVNEGTNVVSYRGSVKGVIGTLSDIYQYHGFRGLYTGLTPNLIGSGAAYNDMKGYVQEDPSVTLSTFNYLTCATLSGIMTLTLVNPIWVVKTRLCLQYEQSAQKVNKTMWGALTHLWRQEGLAGMYRGYLPGLFGVTHGAIQFMLYEQFVNYFNQYYRERPVNTRLSALEYITFASSSKIVATCCTYPYQVLRSRIQDEHRRYNGINHVIRELWKYEGLRGFYKGLFPNIIRSTPACAITFVVYEHSKMFLHEIG